jgi:hypothetical protein
MATRFDELARAVGLNVTRTPSQSSSAWELFISVLIRIAGNRQELIIEFW